MKKNIKFTSLHVFLVLLTFILFGCQSIPNIHSIQDKSAQFDNYQTFGFHPSLMSRGDDYDSLSYRYIKSAIQTQMQKKGYRYADEPDLWVNFNIYIKDKIQINTAPPVSSYYHYRRGYDVWGDYPMIEERITQYTEGSLNIDVIDNHANRLLWEGIAIGRVNEKTYENLEEKINQAVGLIFEKFPN